MAGCGGNASVIARGQCLKTHSPFLHYGRHCIEEDDVAAVTHVLESDWLTTGPAAERFEQALAEKLEVPHAVACSSGTAALHLAALALELKPGDVVVVPAITFLATANVAVHAGAEVVFADVDPDTGLMGPEHFEEALEQTSDFHPAAVFPVHLNGQCCDLPAISAVANTAGMRVVEDAAHAIGARHPSDKGKEVPIGACAYSEMTTFSFHPVKTITMGEGGAVTTGNHELASNLRRLRNHGMVREHSAFRDSAQALDSNGQANPWYYEMHRPGLNYRASDLHCALGHSQLAKLERFVTRRAELVAHYERLLAPYAPQIRNVERVPGTPAWHLCVVLIEFAELGLDRATVMRALQAEGIGTQVHYLPLYRQPWYRERYGELRLSGAEAYYQRCLSLPLYPAMTESDVERVVDSLVEAVGLV